MNSAVFLCILSCLFPTLIYGVPTGFAIRQDSGGGASDDTSSSTPSSDVNLAHNLMTLNVLLTNAFYERAIETSKEDDDPGTAVIFGMGQIHNNRHLSLLNAEAINCSFEIDPLFDNTGTKHVLASMAYMESIKFMGATSLLNNASIDLSPDDQNIIGRIPSDVFQWLSAIEGVASPNVSLNKFPDMTLEDFTSLLFKFSPSCIGDLGLENLPSHFELGYTSPYTRLHTKFNLIVNGAGCADLADPNTGPLFCQVITIDPTLQQAVVSPVIFTNPQEPLCSINSTSLIGPTLLFVTQTADPLSVDPTQRQMQEGKTCSGPELFIVQ
ncbi:hypothetical protein Clacol_001933 [Clathrus columnatus]|uniref:Uncharacterized protein n=1 Tax=Clathrus columnatus TaxID=1419009 RepID=A0AAV5A2K2_9AGAM|nr:hypothetical protein Clacol_001933 [Clathrus columnatus]